LKTKEKTYKEKLLKARIEAAHMAREDEKAIIYQRKIEKKIPNNDSEAKYIRARERQISAREWNFDVHIT
jgi:hypothetical protein